MSRPHTKHQAQKRALPTIFVLLATLLLVGLGSGVASASLSVRVVNTGGDGISSRSAPQLNARNGYGAPEGAAVTALCWTWGDSVGPYNNRLWWQISYAGRTFYAADRFLSTPNVANQPPAGQPQCGAAPPPAPAPAPGPAAPSSGPYLAAATQVRACTGTQYGCLYPGAPTIGKNTAVSMRCWFDGSANGYPTVRWFWVSGAGSEGFVNASLIPASRQSHVGYCGNDKAIVSVQAAAIRNGQSWASESDKAMFAGREWSPGPVGEWAGDCPKLPYVAWRTAGVTIRKNDAITNAGAYRLTKVGTPPPGALMFWGTAIDSHGHEGISVGGGWVASTNGTDNHGAPPNSIWHMNSRGSLYTNAYLGWVMPG